jgi:3-hydroxyanthranilate 3,4-dioxygenase
MVSYAFRRFLDFSVIMMWSYLRLTHLVAND